MAIPILFVPVLVAASLGFSYLRQIKTRGIEDDIVPDKNTGAEDESTPRRRPRARVIKNLGE